VTSRSVGRALLSCALASLVTFVAAAQTSKPKPAPPRIGPATKSKPAPPAEKKPAPAPTPPPAPTDIKIHTKSISGAQVTETGMYFTKVRQRFDFPGIAMITQCDLKRTLQINDGAKLYIVQPFEEGKAQPTGPAAAGSPSSAPPAPGATAQPATKGGIIKYTTTTTDTGERKAMFGLEARHIKVVATREPSSEACDKRLEKVETDGWYVDLPNYSACTAAPKPLAAAQPPSTEQGACVDRVETQAVGDAKLGFSVLSTVTTTSGEKQDVAIISTEVTDLQITMLDPALFDIPPGYSEIKGYPELLPNIAVGGSVADAVFGSISAGTSSVAPKLAGFVRIGIIDPANKSGQTISAAMLREGLTAGFSKRPFDSVPVMGKTPEEVARDAQQKEVDYLLSSELVEVNTTKPSRIGGLVRRASGDASKEIHEARVDYKLFPVDNQTKARLASSARASSSALGPSALRLATFAGSTYINLMPGGSLIRGYLPLAEMGLGSSGPPMPGMVAPGMGAAMTILSLAQNFNAMRAGAGAPGSGEAEVLQTISEAMGNASKAVIEDLNKKK
jgi:hypothetical protein